MRKFHFLYIVLLLPFLQACEEESEATPSATLTLTLSHLVNGEPIEFNTKRYTNAVGNEYDIQEFKYYLSNVKLRNRATGEFFHVPNSYYLVQPTGESHEITLSIPNVPTGTYNELEFAIGVDNAKNYSLDNVGDLDPSNNMAWDWNTGYKFLLLEGSFYPDGGGETRGLIYHIGSDGNYRTLKFPLASSNGTNVTISSGATVGLQFTAEVSEIFKDPTTVNFEEHNVVMFEAISRNVADNYAKNMFQLQETVVD